MKQTMEVGFLVDVMNYGRDSGSDVVHVKATNDSPPDNVWATEDDYCRVWVVNPNDTESPSKKTRLSSSEIGKLFFKTKLCFKFSAGTCPYAANSCHFAHSSEELRLPPPQNRQAEEKPAISVESGRSFKGKHCKKFYSRERCPYGENCTFVHDEASRNSESFAISLGSRGHNAATDGSNIAQTLKPPTWKTRICSKWEITGYCPYGANCNFAHGASELHRFGGLVEGECKIGTSSTPDTKQTGQVDTVISLVSPGIRSQETSYAITQTPNGIKTQRKWKGPTKISRVYGDWIDDIQ